MKQDEEWTRCTVESQGIKVTLETGQGVNFEEVCHALKRAAIGAGYHPETVERWFTGEEK